MAAVLVLGLISGLPRLTRPGMETAMTEPECPGCTCCRILGCYPADGSDCPTDGAGNSTCPCTADDD